MFTLTLQSVSNLVLLREFHAAGRTFHLSSTHRAEYAAIVGEMIDRGMTQYLGQL